MNKDILKKAFIPSVIASLFVIYVIQPTVTSVNIWQSGFHEKFIDAIYANAALGVRNWIDVLFFDFFAGIITGIVFGLFFSLILFMLRKSTKASFIFSKIEHSRIVKGIVISIALLIAIFIVIDIYLMDKIVLADLQLNASFQQRMACLTPYISEQERKEIFAMWAAMENKHDFEQIDKRIENYARNNNIKLPKKLKY